MELRCHPTKHVAVIVDRVLTIFGCGKKIRRRLQTYTPATLEVFWYKKTAPDFVGSGFEGVGRLWAPH